MSGPTSTKTPFNTETLLARSFFYRFIADLFRHPSNEAVRARVDGYQAEWPLALEKLPEGQRAVLGKLLNRLYGEFQKTDESSWIAEFESCFGHTANAAAPAYEIEYGEEHSHREPQELADIGAFYNAFGLKMSDRAHERVDHVSVECEFMSYLLHKRAYAVEHNDAEKIELCSEASKKFFSEHLGRWLPTLAHRLLRQKSTGIMREIAEIALVYVTEDAAHQGLQTGYADMPIRRVREGQETGCVSCLSKPGVAKIFGVG